MAGASMKRQANTGNRDRLPAPHPAQRRIIQEAKRFNVLCCGRRFGKRPVVGSIVGIFSSLHR